MKTINGDTPQLEIDDIEAFLTLSDLLDKNGINKKLREWAVGRKDENKRLKELLTFSIQLMSRPQRGMLDSLFAKAAELGLELEMVKE
jgi:hypothetical protein